MRILMVLFRSFQLLIVDVSIEQDDSVRFQGYKDGGRTLLWHPRCFFNKACAQSSVDENLP